MRLQHQYHREHPGRHGQRDQADVPAVGGPDDDQGHQVIHHRHRQQERPDPVGEPGPDQGQHPQRERGVGEHRRAPALRRRPVIEHQVDPDRDDQATQPGQHRQRQPPPLPQLTHVELAAGLQPEHEEKERHQPAVHPLAQVQRHPRASEPHRQPRPPHRLIRRRADVDPHQRRHRHRDQHRGAARSPCARTPAAAFAGSSPTRYGPTEHERPATGDPRSRLPPRGLDRWRLAGSRDQGAASPSWLPGSKALPQIRG